MSVSVSGFRARFPEFAEADFPDARVDLALEDAALQINAGVWRGKADLGMYYLAAHTLAIEGAAFGGTGGSVPAGPVASETVGDVSRSFVSAGASSSSSSSSANDDLAWTKYGQVYARMRRMVVSTPVVLR